MENQTPYYGCNSSHMNAKFHANWFNLFKFNATARPTDSEKYEWQSDLIKTYFAINESKSKTIFGRSWEIKIKCNRRASVSCDEFKRIMFIVDPHHPILFMNFL